jgi:pimeloyl-ACP methyl ester carboxylesterase
MGNVLNSFLFPAPEPSYTYATIPSPPLHTIDGVPCLHYDLKRAERKGTIVYLHANGTDLGRIRKPLFTWSRDSQYEVIAVEYPGYGVHHGESTPENCIAAALRVLRYARRLSRERGTPLVLVGRSIGTGIASQIAWRHPELYDRLMLISPFESIERMARSKVGVFSVMFMHVLNTAHALQRVSKPLLIVHGRLDRLIPPDHAETLFRSSASPYKYLRILPASDHNLLDWDAIVNHFNGFISPARGAMQ